MRLRATDGGRAVSSGMMFPQIPWETIGSGAYVGLVLSATLGGLAAGGCGLLTLVSRVQRYRHGRASLTGWRPRHDSPALPQAPR